MSMPRRSRDPEQPGQSVLEDGSARFRGNVPAPRVRREPSGDAARRGRPRPGGRGPDSDDSPGAAARASIIGIRVAASRVAGSRSGQGHHVRHWAQGGPTTLSNLALLCRRHHRAVHEEGYQVDRGPTAHSFPTARRPALARDVVGSCGARRSGTGATGQHEAQGLRLHARTTCPCWLGERLDLVWAIDVLHPLATRSTR